MASPPTKPMVTCSKKKPQSAMRAVVRNGRGASTLASMSFKRTPATSVICRKKIARTAKIQRPFNSCQ